MNATDTTIVIFLASGKAMQILYFSCSDKVYQYRVTGQKCRLM